MRFEVLQLENYRCFERLELDFDPAMTVLAGSNGSGKTAVLEALALSLATLFKAWPQAPQGPVGIHQDAARIERVETNGVSERYPFFPVRVRARGELEGAPLWWTRELRTARGKTTTDAASLLEIVAGIGKAVVHGETARLPLIAYYGTQRLWIQKKDTQPKRAIPNRFVGYLDCLDPASNHKHWRDWMFHQTIVELQEGVRSSLLAAVQASIQAAIPHVERFFFDVKNEELRIVWRGGRAQPFEELSDGYRNLVGVFADLAWRAAVLNPADGVEASQKGEGVVLIDEVDLHLHPRLQREVLGAFKRVFPKIQFIVTTHSPQVLGGCQPSWVRLLDDSRDGRGVSQARRVSKIFGWDSNDVLTHIMQAPARSLELVEPFNRFNRAIEAQRWNEAESCVSQLADILGEDHSDVAEARWTLLLERGNVDAQPEEEP